MNNTLPSAPTSGTTNTQAADDASVLSARDCMIAIRGGTLTASALVEACLGRIALREAEVRAWSHLDIDGARKQAQQADARQAAGLPLGPLHGLPIGIKDVFDTCDMPTEYGSSMFQGRRPEFDASAVYILRNAGAIILGKTTTSEFGMYHPSPTRNPVDLSRSPGVSSSGSAAAVVDRMVPLALGTQHTASTTLPASFCGAFAFKPSLGFTSMDGSNILVPRLAHLGLLARSVDDLALFAGAFNPALRNIDRLHHSPRLAIVHGPGWEMTSEDARTALGNFVAELPTSVPKIDLGHDFDGALEVTIELLNAHLAHRFGSLSDEVIAGLCSPLREGITRGKSLSATRFLDLSAAADRYAVRADALFENCNALVTLSTLGEATLLEEGPGSGVMSMLWSLCGLPTVSLPLLRGRRGLPIGVQLVGRRGCDRELLHAAAWLAEQR
jgi:Asp-tRNA(Asn)/Glu-tRNA(Gln) amidotransferase A subunit family amidase